IALLRIQGKAVTAFSGNQNDVHDTIPEAGDRETFIYAPFVNGNHPVFVLKESCPVFSATAQIDEMESFLSRSVALSTEKAEYEQSTEKLLGKFKSGSLHKAVLSRVLNVPAPEQFSATKMFKQLCDTYPNAAVHLF